LQSERSLGHRTKSPEEQRGHDEHSGGSSRAASDAECHGERRKST
jgi:hypothetical protein